MRQNRLCVSYEARISQPFLDYNELSGITGNRGAWSTFQSWEPSGSLS